MTSKTRRLGAAGLALAAVVALAAWQLRPAPSADEGIRASINTFVVNVGQWRVHEALKVVSKRFRSESFTRGDIARGLLQLRQTWDALRISVAEVRIVPEADGRQATAQVLFSLGGATVDGRSHAAGAVTPLTINTSWALEGRQWRCIAAGNVPTITGDGIY